MFQFFGPAMEMYEYGEKAPRPEYEQIKKRAVYLWENRTADTLREEGFDVFQMYDPLRKIHTKTDKEIEEWQKLLTDQIREEGYPLNLIIKRQHFNQSPDKNWEIFLHYVPFETVEDWRKETEQEKEAA